MAESTPVPPTKAPRRAAAARARAVSRGVAASARSTIGRPTRPLPLVDPLPLPLPLEVVEPAPSSTGDASSSGGAPGSPGKAKRVLANRQSAQRSRMRKLQFISNLEANVDKLQSEINVLAPRVTAARRDAAAVVAAHAALAANAADALKEAAEHVHAIKGLKSKLPRSKTATLPAAPPPDPPFTAAAFAPGPGHAAAAAAAAAVNEPIVMPPMEPPTLPPVPSMPPLPPPIARRGGAPPPVRTAAAAGLRAASPLGGVFGSLDSPFGFGPDDLRLTPMTPLEFGGAAGAPF